MTEPLPERTTPVLPTFIVACGPPGGYGKTTLAHKIARTIGCPAICRDEIKEGMVHAHPGFLPGPGDPLTQKALPVFFEVLALLLHSGTTVVAEAAFQDKLWRPGLEPLANLANIYVVQCTTDPDTAHARNTDRYHTNPIRKAAHTGVHPRRPTDGRFAAISLPVPTLLVDTTDGYTPSLDDIATFINRPRRTAAPE
jgi:predicted kinase